MATDARPSLEDVLLETTGWRVYTSSPFDRAWFDDRGDPVRVRLFASPAPEHTLPGWRTRAQAETSAGGGGVVSFDELELDGLMAFRGVFKYPASRAIPNIPADSLQVYIVGMMSVPLGARSLQINTEALEQGDTGTREAIFALRQPKPPPPPPDATPISMEAFFDRVRGTLGRVLPSDTEEMDEHTPWHPLSRVRARQRQIARSIRIGPALQLRGLP